MLLWKALAAAALTARTTFAGNFTDPAYNGMPVLTVAMWGDKERVYAVEVQYVDKTGLTQYAYHGVPGGTQKILYLDEKEYITDFTASIVSERVWYLALTTNTGNFTEFGYKRQQFSTQLQAEQNQKLGGFYGEEIGDGVGEITDLYPLFVAVKKD